MAASAAELRVDRARAVVRTKIALQTLEVSMAATGTRQHPRVAAMYSAAAGLQPVTENELLRARAAAGDAAAGEELFVREDDSVRRVLYLETCAMLLARVPRGHPQPVPHSVAVAAASIAGATRELRDVCLRIRDMRNPVPFQGAGLPELPPLPVSPGLTAPTVPPQPQQPRHAAMSVGLMRIPLAPPAAGGAAAAAAAPPAAAPPVVAAPAAKPRRRKAPRTAVARHAGGPARKPPISARPKKRRRVAKTEDPP
jgi:hypothetical protein